MLSSQWLDIAIGVVLVWFLFALAVSAVNEGVVKVLALRSKQLWSALRQMLDGTESPQGILSNLVGLPSKGRPSSPNPAANAGVAARMYATETVQALEIRTKPGQKTRIEHIPASVFSSALMELASGAAQVPGAVNQVDSYVRGLPPGPLKSQLNALLVGAGGDITRFRDSVERWFDGQMTRLSRLYRAQVHIILVFLGLLVAFLGFGLGLQSNSLQLVSELQHDQNLRTMVVGAATAAARGDLAKAGGCDLATAADPAGCQLKGASKLSDINFALRGDAPPVGTSFGQRLGFLVPWRHPYALLGVLVTGFAISFGSSFWFALLKRLVGLRSGGGTGTG